MALQAKAIKGKIGSVSNIKKMTKAMERVAAARMRRAVERALNSRHYTAHLYTLLLSLVKNRTHDHPLLKSHGEDKILVVGISSNRGLCGGFNTILERGIKEYWKEYDEEVFDFMAIGKSMDRFAREEGETVVANIPSLGDNVTSQDIKEVAERINKLFVEKKYAKVVVAYMHFGSAFSQKPTVHQILPIEPEAINLLVRDVEEEYEGGINQKIHYLYEPSGEQVLDFILPRVAEARLYQALLESLASEHSSRMVAMKNASDNAQSMIQDLTLAYNRARQEAVTREIAEISSAIS